MAVIDSRSLGSAASIDTDLCIVGAGAAGLTLAADMRKRGRDVCVVEAGGFEPDGDVQALHDLQSIGYPPRENHMARARYYGGSCNLWAGRAMRLSRIDVEDRPWLGERGWPVSYEELEGFYTKAADVLSLPRVAANDIPTTLSQDERVLLNASSLQPTTAFWAPKPMRFGRAYRHLFRDADCKLLLRANATEIALDEQNRSVVALHARTLEGGHLQIRARLFVLAAGGLENARLLLASRQREPTGIGNRNDLVGRFFMDHPRVVYGRVRLARRLRFPTILGSPLADGKLQVGIGLSPELQRREGLVNTYLSLEPQLSQVAVERYRTSIGVAKVLLRRGHAGGRMDWAAMRMDDIKDMIYLLTPKEILPHVVYRGYAGLKRLVAGDWAPENLTVINYCEQPPNRDSRAYLSEQRDRLGMNKLVLDWRVGAAERRSIVRLHEVLGEHLRRTGLGSLESDPAEVDRLIFTDASHHIGTTRMSDDPRQGVVDSHCRVHGMENLYMAGSSVFPTSGSANPTWTIVALTLRLAEHLSRD